MNIIAVPLFLLTFVAAQIYITNDFLKLQIRLLAIVGGLYCALSTQTGVVILLISIGVSLLLPQSRKRWKDFF